MGKQEKEGGFSWKQSFLIPFICIKSSAFGQIVQGTVSWKAEGPTPGGMEPGLGAGLHLGSGQETESFIGSLTWSLKTDHHLSPSKACAHDAG